MTAALGGGYYFHFTDEAASPAFWEAGEDEGQLRGSRPHEAPVPSFTHSSPPRGLEGGVTSPDDPRAPPWDSEPVRQSETCGHRVFLLDSQGKALLTTSSPLDTTHTHTLHTHSLSHPGITPMSVQSPAKL